MNSAISNRLGFSISQRLSAGFGFMFLLMAAMVGGSAFELDSLTAHMRQIVDVNNKQTAYANELLNAIDGMAIQSRTISLVVDLSTITNEVKEFQRLAQEYERVETQLEATLAVGDEGKEGAQLFSEIVALRGKALAGIQLAVKQGSESASVEASATLNQVRPVETAWRNKVTEFIALQNSRTALAVDDAKSSRDKFTVLGLTLLMFALISGGVVAMRVILSIKRPINRAILISERIANGDLTGAIEVEGTDEIGRLVQSIVIMQLRLRELVTEIRHAADSIRNASAEVATGNADLSYRTEQTASKLQLTASSMGSLTSMVRQSVEAAVHANSLVSTAVAVASRGGSMVDEVIVTMNEINGSSRKIFDIIGVIDSIAFQTNILALNAAVESARAGEQGRGFAVVAGEVRNLAKRSASAAQEIKALIGNSVEHVKAGARVVGDTGDTMKEIVESVNRVLDTIGEIELVAGEQRAGIEEMNQAVVLLDHMTQQNAAMVEEGTAATERLRDEAAHLSGMVSTFKLDD